MIRIFSLALGLILTFSASAQMTFESSDWDSILTKAKKEDKLIFVEGYAQWCAPCKWMASEVFTKPEVGAFYNSNFINVKYDLESLDATDFVYKYGSLGVPTLYFIDADGNLVHQVRGAAKPKKFIDIGKDALNPNKQLLTLQRKYESKTASDKDLKNYLDALVKSGKENNDNILGQYIKGKDKNSPEIMKTIFQNTTPSINAPLFSSIITQKGQYSMVLGQKVVYDKIYRAAVNDGEQQEIDPTDLNALEAHFANYFDAGSARNYVDRTYLENLMYSDDEANKILFVYEAQGILADEPDFGGDFYGEIARVFNSQYSDPSALESALRWVNIGLEEEIKYSRLITKANLLVKLGKQKEALETANKAMDFGKIISQNTYEAQELIKKLRP